MTKRDVRLINAELIEVPNPANLCVNIVEDHLEQFSSVTELLHKSDYSVKTWQDTDDVSEQALNDDSLWVVDKRFGREPKGLKLIDKLKAKRGKRVILFTAFGDSQQDFGTVQYDGEKNNLVLAVSKPISIPASSDKVVDFFDYFFRSNRIPGEMIFEEEKSELEIYNELSFDEQDAVLDRVSEKFEEKIGEAWASGAVWVCIFGQNGDEIECSSDHSGILNEAGISEIEQKLQKPAFIFDRSLAFNSTPISASRGASHVPSYPTLELSAQRGQDEETAANEKFEMHFDTGADLSLFCEEFANSIPSAVFGRNRKAWLQSQEHKVRDLELAVLLRSKAYGDPQRGQTARISRKVTFKGLSVKNWQTSDFRIDCGEHCKQKEITGICNIRNKGLIGRDFLRENVIDVVLKSEEPRVQIVRK